ncbi:MAG TPA: AMP-binding protein [Casimicrobiaceae bacterium]|jgi:long-chain acyl-CoA synthetase
MRTFRDVIDEKAKRSPSSPFLFAPEPQSTLTYDDLRRRARAFAADLQSRRILPGAVVGFMLPNGVAAASTFLSAMYGGYIVLPINLLAQDAQLDHILRHAAPAIIVVAPDLEERLRSAIERTGSHAIVEIVAVDDPGDVGREAQALAPIEPKSPAMLMYTSGTTGTPKGVLLSHANLIYAGSAIASAHELTENDRVLSSLPLYHINGQCIATVAPLVSGGSVVMPHRFSVSQWWPLVERYRPTWLNVVPTIMAYLLHGPELTPAQMEACRRVRFARSASAPLPPEQHRAFESRFGISVLEALGLTECASVAFANPLDRKRRKIGSVGMPLGVEARVVTADGTVLGEAQPGEIQIRGANVMLSYFRAPQDTWNAVNADGWLATGDLGYRDADGFYFVTGRLKELIIKGGENIAPREIDEALLRHPAVLEGAAVGVPDDQYGQEILACVVVKPQFVLTETELRAHCERELGRYKTPKFLRFVAELPKGPSGKVQRLKLVEYLR